MIFTYILNFFIVHHIRYGQVKLKVNLKESITKSAFRAKGFGLATAWSSCTKIPNLISTFVGAPRTIVTKKSKKHWRPITIIHVLLISTLFAATTSSEKLKTEIRLMCLIVAGILGAWWTGVRQQNWLSWSWDPVEIVITAGAVLNLVRTHILARLCETFLSLNGAIITPRLIRGGCLRTAHHTRIRISKKSAIWDINFEPNEIIFKKHGVLFLLLWKYKNFNVLGYYYNTIVNWRKFPIWLHIGISLSLILIAWPKWGLNGLVLGGYVKIK